MVCRSFPMSTRLCKEACAFLCVFIGNSVFSRNACCIYKHNNKKRSAGDDEHGTAKKIIEKGISRKWVAPIGESESPVG